jgi:DNA-damage-inducible protein J
MSAKVQTSLRLDEDILIEAKQILKALGLNFTEAVNIFTNMVVQEKGLPFAVKIPNKETLQAIKEFENGETKKITLAELEEAKQRASRIA